MNCTNCGDECAYVKAGFVKKDKECPYYLESFWLKDGDQEPTKIKDCFPKKFGLEQNRLLHRFLAVQSVVEDVRNRMDRLESQLDYLITNSQEYLQEKKSTPPSLKLDIESQKQIENDDDDTCGLNGYH